MDTVPAAHILVVDDDATIRDALRMILTDEGYAVLEAADGVECIDALLLSHERLIVLLDLMMPRMTGFDVLAYVLADGDHILQHDYIIMTANMNVMAHAGPHLSALLHRLHIPVIGKPFEIDDLLARVDYAARHVTRDIGQSHQAGEM